MKRILLLILLLLPLAAQAEVLGNQDVEAGTGFGNNARPVGSMFWYSGGDGYIYDSITYYAYIASGNPLVRAAVMVWDSANTDAIFADSTVGCESGGSTGWISEPLYIRASLENNKWLMPTFNADQSATVECRYAVNSGTKLWYYNLSWTGAWATVTTFTITENYVTSIYITYSLAGAETSPTRRRRMIYSAGLINGVQFSAHMADQYGPFTYHIQGLGLLRGDFR